MRIWWIVSCVACTIQAMMLTSEVGDHTPAVALLLVDPPFAVEWCRDKRRLHERHGREARRNHLFKCTDRGQRVST